MGHRPARHPRRAEPRRDGGREGPLLAFASGNLCYQIEHRPFRGLPSNRYAEIATRVRGLCDNFDLPTPPGLLGQYLQTVRTI